MGLEDELMPLAREEFIKAGDLRRATWTRSMRAWTFACDGDLVCLAGVFKTTLMGSGVEIWFMCCNGFTQHLRESLRAMRRTLRRVAMIYPNLRVTVDSRFAAGLKFVRRLGFTQTTLERKVNDHTFYVFSLIGGVHG